MEDPVNYETPLLVHFGAKWWKEGAKVRYHDMAPGRKPEYRDVTPGLYWYSGLGSGYFFRPDGTMLDCSPSEARAEARRLGIERDFRYVDSFINTGSAVCVGD